MKQELPKPVVMGIVILALLIIFIIGYKVINKPDPPIGAEAGTQAPSGAGPVGAKTVPSNARTVKPY